MYVLARDSNYRSVGVVIDWLVHYTNNVNTSDDSDETFSSIFWKQQLQAAQLKSSRQMRWHPAMIRWCLYLQYKSSGLFYPTKLWCDQVTISTHFEGL